MVKRYWNRLGVAMVAAVAIALLAGAAAQAAVTVSNVSVAQRPGTKLMYITHDVSNAGTVSLAVSNGTTARTGRNRARYCRSADRDASSPDSRCNYHYFGFRPARTLP